MTLHIGRTPMGTVHFAYGRLYGWQDSSGGWRIYPVGVVRAIGLFEYCQVKV